MPISEKYNPLRPLPFPRQSYFGHAFAQCPPPFPLSLIASPPPPPAAMRRSKILDISTLEEDPGAAMEFARSKSSARKEGLTGVEFSDVAGLGPILGEVIEVVEFLKVGGEGGGPLLHL